MEAIKCLNYKEHEYVDDDLNIKTTYYCDRFDSNPFIECHCDGNPNNCDYAHLITLSLNLKN